jgi:epoxyqueuosine reductase QueG
MEAKSMSLRKEIVALINKEVLESESKGFFREPLVGFASAEDPLFAQLPEIVGPEHVSSPKELLPEAKTVVAFFVPFSKDVVIQNKKAAEVSPKWAQAYVHANNLINKISETLIEQISKNGITGTTIKATHTFDPVTLTTGWSHRSAAFIAGLGRFGLNRMLITPKGCAGRYGSIIIAEELTADLRPKEEPCTYFTNGQCQFCINNCPVKALTVNGIDKHKCNNRLLEVSKRFTDFGLCDVCGKCAIGPCATIA